MTDTTRPSTEAAVSKTAIRYPNLSGALVTVDAHREERAFGGLRLVFSARCSGCLDSYDRGALSPNLDRPRDWAAKHSAACRAMPQPKTDDHQ